ncbi:MAG: hydrolase, partial [Sulfurovaceae bacterium]|nr:hydrolase [Sulfurovaceae bacterium]
KGFASVVMHFRGCYQEENLRPRAYHSGDTGDAKEWIEHLQKNYPKSKLHTVGFSLGGNMMLKLLGEWGTASPISSAVSISAPMQLNISADTIEKGFAKNYQEYLLKPLRATLIKKYQKFDIKKEIGIDTATVAKIKTIREFDERYTAVIHGFKSANDYYQKCSAKQFLKDITTPTLIIHSLDDPFMTPAILPKLDEMSSAIELEVLENGGHVGFVNGSLWRPTYWLDRRITSHITLHNPYTNKTYS